MGLEISEQDAGLDLSLIDIWLVNDYLWLMVDDYLWHLWLMARKYLSGWWLTYPSEKYEFVSWDDEISNIWENKSHVPNHQPNSID